MELVRKAVKYRQGWRETPEKVGPESWDPPPSGDTGTHPGTHLAEMAPDQERTHSGPTGTHLGDAYGGVSVSLIRTHPSVGPDEATETEATGTDWGDLFG